MAEPKRRSTYIAPDPDTYNDWLKTNHPEQWASLQPEAVERYQAHMAALRGMRPDADDEGKYGRGVSL